MFYATNGYATVEVMLLNKMDVMLKKGLMGQERREGNTTARHFLSVNLFKICFACTKKSN